MALVGVTCHRLRDGDGNDGRPAPCYHRLYAHHALDENTGYVRNLGGERWREVVGVLRKHIAAEDNEQLEDQEGTAEGNR